MSGSPRVKSRSILRSCHKRIGREYVIAPNAAIAASNSALLIQTSATEAFVFAMRAMISALCGVKHQRQRERHHPESGQQPGDVLRPLAFLVILGKQAEAVENQPRNDEEIRACGNRQPETHF